MQTQDSQYLRGAEPQWGTLSATHVLKVARSDHPTGSRQRNQRTFRHGDPCPLKDCPHCEGPCSRSPSCRLPSCTRGASGRSLPWPARRRALRRRSTGSAQAGRPRTCAASDSEAPRREFDAAPPRQNPSAPSAPFSTVSTLSQPRSELNGGSALACSSGTRLCLSAGPARSRPRPPPCRSTTGRAV